MFKKWFKRSRSIIILVVCMVCLLMIVGCIAMLAQFSGILEDEARYIGLHNSDDVSRAFNDTVFSYEVKARSMGDALISEAFADESDFSIHLRRLTLEEAFSDVMFTRYIKGEHEYTSDGEEFDTTLEAQNVLELAKLRVLSCAGVISDRQYSIAAVVFCVPLDNCVHADTLLVYYPVGRVVSDFESNYTGDASNSLLTAVCSSEGEVISVVHIDESLDILQHNNIYEAFEGDLNDKDTIDSLKRLAVTGSSEAYNVRMFGESNVLAQSTIKDDGNVSFFTIGLYRSADLCSLGYAVIYTLIGALIVFFLLLLFLTIYIVVSRYRKEKRMSEESEINRILNCPTRQKFEKVSADIIARNTATSFAVVVIDINHYEYIAEQIGIEQMTKILLHLKMLYSGMLELDETYGHIEDGRFALLLHYRDIEMLANKLKSLAALISTRTSQFAEKYALVAYGGIYLTSRSITNSVSKMIDLAVDAEKATQFPYDFGTFRFYNELLHASNVENEYIETHMDSALANDEFKVFYQAKYNIAQDKPDGCEALVRWYNPELDDYMQPGVFLPLFEANKFIVKVDKYIYEQVCIYIEEALLSGQTIYPVSVNVSRITASESDFTSHYISVKQKHNIPDGFITIEFTESFAYEDYDMLRQIVQTLHKNGFKCSIDDFGSGFSSYNILKELPMDEIKLDRFFIKNGFSNERDLKILSSVINLGRELNMKVTQEGVETVDQLALLKKLGCHVIQGYHYSKPLSLPDYIDFISKKTLK